MKILSLLQLWFLWNQFRVIYSSKSGNSNPSTPNLSKISEKGGSKEKEVIRTSNAKSQTHKVSTTPAIIGSSLIEVYEHEYYDSELKAWIGGSNMDQPHRWTSSATNAEDEYVQLLPPPKLEAPEGYEYSSDWKIDITGKIRDELGWEYFIDSSEVLQEGEATEEEMTDTEMSGDTEILTQKDNPIAISKGRRRRRWLRTVSPIEVTISAATASLTEERPKSGKKKRKQQKLLSSTMLARKMKLLKSDISDSFNFKGYGLTFVKSLIRRESVGAVWRLPLTAHFDALEMRPYIPLVTTTVGIFYPVRGSVSINASLPMEFINCSVLRMVDWAQYLVACIWWLLFQTLLWHGLCKLILWNSMCVVASFLGFGPTTSSSKKDSGISDGNDTKKSVGRSKSVNRAFIRLSSGGSTTALTPFSPPNYPSRRTVTYRGDISHRLGVSFTWGVSEELGSFFRYNWWHLYMPTIDCISNVLENTSKQLLNAHKEETLEDNYSTSTSQTSTKNKKSELREWLRQKSSTLGVNWGGFGCIPEAPYYTCTALFSMSGFYGGSSIVRQMYTFCQNPLMRRRIRKVSLPSRKGTSTSRPLESNLANTRNNPMSSSSTELPYRKPDLSSDLREEEAITETYVDTKIRA